MGARYQVNDTLAVTAHGTWTDTDVYGPIQQLRQRPEQRGGASLRWNVSTAVALYAGWRYVGARLDAAIPTGECMLPSYTRLDLSLNWQVDSLTALQIAIDNVTNRRYEDAIGFPSLGARLRLALRRELGPRH
jgi:outer membrane receptor protein involved in Fe transport